MFQSFGQGKKAIIPLLMLTADVQFNQQWNGPPAAGAAAF
jgi:hypothetical protein